MLFHSAPFFFFFTATFVGYWLIPQHRVRMVWLLVASFAFYGTWNPWLLFVVLFSAAFDFLIAQRIEASTSPKARRSLLILSICLSLSILGFFKYTNFLLDSAVSTFNFFGFDYRHPAFRIVLPLGISFYTFETISYVVDVYKRRLRAERNFLDYALFIMFFPHLISGPIVRPRQFLVQLRRTKRFDWLRLEVGARLFLLGLIKKAVIADNLAGISDQVFAAPSTFASEAVWVAVFCYTGQIYCDFSGYTDMAIGAAHAFGFKLPVNFNMPYASSNVSEFWHRWHISLSTWLRDYLYFPLGGSRYGELKTSRNLIITMGLSGLWHGAGWPFILCGLYHGTLLVLHRLIPTPRWFDQSQFKPLKILLTFLFVAWGFVFFRAQSFADVLTIFQRLFVPTGGEELARPDIILALTAWGAIVIGHLAGSYLNLPRVLNRLPAPVMATGVAVALLLVQLLTPSGGGSFIYFQF
jgi:alginate O-acetyltransferase complex protein AlgI